MAFNPKGGRNGGQPTMVPSVNNQARGESGAGTNSGSFKAVGHSDHVGELTSAAPVPGYTGPVHPAGSRMGGLPTWMSDAPRESRPALDTYSKGLLDADMQEILSDPTFTDADKENYRSMAEALESNGAGYTNAGLGQRVTFLPGSFYGGRPVPEGFKRFHAEVDREGRAAMEAEAERDRLQRAADASPMRDVPQGEALAPAGTGYGRISEADFRQLEAVRKSRHDALYVAPKSVIREEQEAVLIEMSSDQDFLKERQSSLSQAPEAPAKKSVLGRLFGR